MEIGSGADVGNGSASPAPVLGGLGLLCTKEGQWYSDCPGRGAQKNRARENGRPWRAQGECSNNNRELGLDVHNFFLNSRKAELTTFYLYPDFCHSEFALALTPPYKTGNTTLIKWHFVRFKPRRYLPRDR